MKIKYLNKSFKSVQDNDHRVVVCDRFEHKSGALGLQTQHKSVVDVVEGILHVKCGECPEYKPNTNNTIELLEIHICGE